MVDPKITFGEFVAMAKSNGIKDDTEIEWIDFAGADELRFNVYDNGVRATIAGKINWDEPTTKPKKLKRKLT